MFFMVFCLDYTHTFIYFSNWFSWMWWWFVINFCCRRIDKIEWNDGGWGHMTSITILYIIHNIFYGNFFYISPYIFFCLKYVFLGPLLYFSSYYQFFIFPSLSFSLLTQDVFCTSIQRFINVMLWRSNGRLKNTVYNVADPNFLL